MPEPIIQIETLAKQLNVAQLMKNCDVKLKDVVVLHKLTTNMGYLEMRIANMRLHGATLSGDIRFVYFGEVEDRFGRKNYEEQIFGKNKPKKIEKRTLLQCLGLGWLVDKQNEESIVCDKDTTEIKIDHTIEKMWEITVENKALYSVDEDFNFSEKLWKPMILDSIKTALMTKAGILISNELIRAVFDPMLECLCKDWRKVLDF
jgi:hypothetical protein